MKKILVLEDEENIRSFVVINFHLFYGAIIKFNDNLHHPERKVRNSGKLKKIHLL